MNSPNDCLEDIQNGKHGKYPYMLTLTDFTDVPSTEQSLEAICEAYLREDYADVMTFARGLAYQITDAMLKRAEAMSEASRNPLDESNLADIRKEM